MAIIGGAAPRFVLPAERDGTLRVEPGAVLLVSARQPGAAPERSEVVLTVSGLGLSFDFTADLGPGESSDPVEIDLAEELPSYVRGLYRAEGTLVYDDAEVCTVRFNVRVRGFGRPIATGAAASGPLAAGGLNAKLKAKIQLKRHRPTGWRRYLSVPAWGKTISGTVLGAITGIAGAIVLQQAGAITLTPSAAVYALVEGGGVTFGVSYSLGAVWTYVRPTVAEEDETES